MSSSKLPNHVRLHRKRFGLSQQEIDFLLGGRYTAKACRYEAFSRVPSLETALSLSVIFGIPVAELFPGEYEKAERAVCRRAKGLEEQLREKADERTVRKLASIKAMTSAESNYPCPKSK